MLSPRFAVELDGNVIYIYIYGTRHSTCFHNSILQLLSSFVYLCMSFFIIKKIGVLAGAVLVAIGPIVWLFP